MKSSFVSLVLTSSVGFAGPQLPEFSDQLGPMQSVYLAHAIEAGRVPTVLPETLVRRGTKPVPKTVSRMPVIAPDENVDPRMPIVRPDGQVDHRMTVKEPAVGPAK